MRYTIALAALLAGCLDVEPETSEDVAALDVVRPSCWYTAETVRTADQLAAALASSNRHIEIPSGTVIDLSAYRELEIPSCTIISGTRDGLDRGALLYTTDATAQYPLFVVRGNHVRIERLRIRGPSNPDVSRSNSIPATTGILVRVGESTGRGIVIENNELYWWGNAAVAVRGPITQSMPSEVPADTPLVGWDNVGQVVVRRNYIHHNAINGLGYGVRVDSGAYATIERNVFDYNRHAIASNGKPYTGYRARHNYVLDGGYSEENNEFDYWNQHFDVHGSGSGGYDGVAGEKFEVSYNTFRGAQGYGFYPWNYQRPCMMVRATPMDRIDFHANIALQWSDQCMRRKGKDEPVERVYDYDNTFHLDTHDELGVGDFDGDGRDDVIVTTGTAWYYSSSGRADWRYLRNSGIRVGDLAFADIDNDGTTDAIARLADGNLNVAYSGTSSWTPLTATAEPISQHRFGDFDGDGSTDIFRRQASGVWQMWYGSSRSWTTLRTYGVAIDDLRFGEFDGVTGTDVLTTSSGAWMLTSGARSAWVRINDALAPLRETRTGDFDADGRTDLAHQANGQWRFASGARGGWHLLRSDGGVALASVQLGNFNGTDGTDALRFGSAGRFAAWYRGYGDAFYNHSWHSMR